MDLVCDWKGGGLLSLSSISYMGEGEQLEWAVTLAIPACEDSCGGGWMWLLQVTWKCLSWIRGASLLLATALLAVSGDLLGEVCMEGLPGMSNVEFDRRPSNSSIMLGPMVISLGHSITECGEETGINDHKGTTFRDSY